MEAGVGHLLSRGELDKDVRLIHFDHLKSPAVVKTRTKVHAFNSKSNFGKAAADLLKLQTGLDVVHGDAELRGYTIPTKRTHVSGNTLLVYIRTRTGTHTLFRHNRLGPSRHGVGYGQCLELRTQTATFDIEANNDQVLKSRDIPTTTLVQKRLIWFYVGGCLFYAGTCARGCVWGREDLHMDGATGRYVPVPENNGFALLCKAFSQSLLQLSHLRL